MATFGKILLDLIKARNISVSQFARQIGVSAKTAHEWVGEDARFPNSPDTIKKIANFFDISVHELLYGEHDPKSLIGSLLEKTVIHSGYYKLTVEKVNIDEKKTTGEK